VQTLVKNFIAAAAILLLAGGLAAGLPAVAGAGDATSPAISPAPAATDARTSAMRCGSGFSPAGNPADTAATGIPLPASSATAAGTRAW